MSAYRLKALVQHLDKITGKHANRSWIASQSSHPPQSVARVQRFDQVSFYESEIAFCLSAPRVCGPAPAGEFGWEVRWCTHGEDVVDAPSERT